MINLFFFKIKKIFIVAKIEEAINGIKFPHLLYNQLYA
ncbi:hypothetical protein MPD5_0098 [Melissococcus plutonius DAT561]|uniref:Uncharacterized protein n=1 Tax=Melissococcus plutonius TaxID=33970 RepID=A0A2Z5Y0B8_9ENTE|nr:hypothetical protein MPD5_0098 [Melissococcus plutonius DAT561]BBC60265.1 hypothetical protein DAT561_0097 [Melissococcus plutonius]